MAELKMLNLKYALINNGFFVIIFVGALIGFHPASKQLLLRFGVMGSLILAVAYGIFVLKVVYPKYPIYNQRYWQVTKVGWSLTGLGILLLILVSLRQYSPYYWAIVWVICLLRDYFSVQKKVAD